MLLTGKLSTKNNICLPSGHILELTWDVPENSGPGVSDPNCISYAYFSSVNFIKVHTVFPLNSHMEHRHTHISHSVNLNV